MPCADFRFQTLRYIGWKRTKGEAPAVGSKPMSLRLWMSVPEGEPNKANTMFSVDACGLGGSALNTWVREKSEWTFVALLAEANNSGNDSSVFLWESTTLLLSSVGVWLGWLPFFLQEWCETQAWPNKVWWIRSRVSRLRTVSVWLGVFARILFKSVFFLLFFLNKSTFFDLTIFG